MYVMDYGVPVGYRLALKHPDSVSALIVWGKNDAVFPESGTLALPCRTRIDGGPKRQLTAETARVTSPINSRSQRCAGSWR